MKNKDLKKGIIELSYKHKLSHIGSCLTAVDIIDAIYSTMSDDPTRDDFRFVLSSGHAGLALYVVLEKYYMGIDAEDLLEKHGVHPNRDIKNKIYVSSGSLGHGIGIAVGMALSDRTKTIHCLLSDGEASEGSVWEALRIVQEQGLDNLKIYINFNNWGAYKFIDSDYLFNLINTHNSFSKSKVEIKVSKEDWVPWLLEQEAHYVVMNTQQYEEVMKLLQ